MTDSAGPGTAVVRRWIHHDRSVILGRGDFSSLFEAWHRHAVLWESEPDGFSVTLMRQGLAAAALFLSHRPRDESVAWTINIHQPPTNIFLTGEARHSTVTGRVYTEAVKTVDSSRFYVQSYRPGGEPTLSVIEVLGLDVLEIFEQYYNSSAQHPARFFELDVHDVLMVLGLPEVDRTWLASLDRASALALHDAGKLLEEREFRFECGCTPGKMLTALRDMFREHPEELFGADEQVEVSCPRCGRRWWVQWQQFMGPGGIE